MGTLEGTETPAGASGLSVASGGLSASALLVLFFGGEMERWGGQVSETGG